MAVNVDGNMSYDICEDEVTLDYIEIEMVKRGNVLNTINFKLDNFKLGYGKVIKNIICFREIIFIFCIKMLVFVRMLVWKRELLLIGYNF